MFGLGMGEIIIILVLALILLGPQKLPEAAKQIGKGLREFRKATDDLKSQFEGEFYADDAKPAKPTLVETPRPAGAAVTTSASPADVPAARADNVPGLEAALAEVPPAAPPSPAPEAPLGDPQRSAPADVASTKAS